MDQTIEVLFSEIGSIANIELSKKICRAILFFKGLWLRIVVTANSLYGQTGSKTSSFYEIDIAASTTAMGRNLLMYGKRVIEECYGDTIIETKNYGEILIFYFYKRITYNN